MGANRRFFVTEAENKIFHFQVDTRNIVEGATNGSENPLTFKIPYYRALHLNSFIIRVLDGRPDKAITNTSVDSDYIITFAIPGIYDIQLIGSNYILNFANGLAAGGYNNLQAYDSLKLIRIKKWVSGIFSARCFWNCINLIIDAHNTLILPPNSEWFFQGIKGFESNLNLIDTSRVVGAANLLLGIKTPLKTILNPFWNSLINFTNIYLAVTLDSSLDKIEVTSYTITNFSQGFVQMTSANPNLRIVLNTPNLKTLYRLKFNNSINSHFGEIDIRSVTNANGWIQVSLSIYHTDQTLLGWVNNFDWSGVAPITNKVTFDFVNSKYSNNPAVIAAKTFLEAKGIVFTNLTMA